MNLQQEITHPLDFLHHSDIDISEIWLDDTPTVQPGLAPSLASIIARHNAGIPNTVETRALESYFKNLDLTDIDRMSKEYQSLVDRYDRTVKAREDYIKSKVELQKQESARVLDYIKKQESSNDKNDKQ